MNSILLCLGSLINCRCSKKNDYFCCMEMLITKDQLHNTQSCMKLAMDERYLNDKKKKIEQPRNQDYNNIKQEHSKQSRA